MWNGGSWLQLLQPPERDHSRGFLFPLGLDHGIQRRLEVTNAQLMEHDSKVAETNDPHSETFVSIDCDPPPPRTDPMNIDNDFGPWMLIS